MNRPILLLEDDDNDVYLLRYAFKQAGITNRVIVMNHGHDAIEYLSPSGKYADREHNPLPCLLLLDLKLPLQSGFEVLEWIRSRPELRSLVVIVLSASAQPDDVGRAYQLGVNSFIVKPSDVQRRREIAEHLKGWWLEINQFPPPPPN